jgi:hypothetical protein
MRKQGLDPTNKEDVKSYINKADFKKDELRKHLHRNIKDTDAINDINKFLGSGLQTDINPFTGKKELDRIFSIQQDGSVRSVRIGNHETRNPNNQHYHLENWNEDGKFIKPDESVKINRTGNN